MKLACKKCNTINTKDLYPVKYWKKVIKDDNEEFYLPDGSFCIYKNLYGKSSYFIHDYSNDFLVPPSSILDQSQLMFVRGWGCCGNSGVDLKCFCCEQVIGVQYLDCYETKHIQLLDKKIFRIYKK